MKFTSHDLNLAHLKAELVVFVLRSEDLKKGLSSKHSLSILDKTLEGVVSSTLIRSDFKTSADTQMLFGPLSKHGVNFVLTVGWEGKRGTEDYRRLGSIICATAKKLKINSVCVAQDNLDLKERSFLQALYEGLRLAKYKFEEYFSKPEDVKKSDYSGISEIKIIGKVKLSERAIRLGSIFANATCMARDLINTPPNDCTPRFLVDAARDLAKKNKLKIDVFGEAELKRMGAGGILSVAFGSDAEPYLIRIKYPGKKGGKRIAIVGKGITFDSGGLSIKTGEGMETMKCDMSGAAAVLSVMSVINILQPNSEVWAYVPTCENMINGKAMRPGDIIKAMNGKSIEVLNTDAEGRLILADALSLAVKDGCDTIIDLATLTGACVVALGLEYAGLFSNDSKLRDRITEAGLAAGEKFWELPLAPEYKANIKSTVADIKNIGTPGAGAGATVGALFLQEFVNTAKWAHLDIAGPAFTKSESFYIAKGGVGFGVRTLLNLLQNF